MSREARKLKMIGKQFDQITKEDIEALVTDQIREGRAIEYKEILPGGGDEERREFYADITSLANAGGGDLILGIKEARDSNGKPLNIPEAALGVATVNAEADMLGLDTGIRTGIAPRIHGVKMRAIDGFPIGPVIVTHVPQSFNAPHMVTYKTSSRFHGRSSAGKYHLDVTEIRAAFAASEALPERLRSFRAGRLNLILAGETPVSLRPGAKIVLHVVPASAMAPTVLQRIKLRETPIAELQAIGGGIGGHRFNFDGRVTYTMMDRSTGTAASYTQMFHTGAIEAVDTEILKDRSPQGSDGSYIPSDAYERYIINAVKQYTHLLGTVLGMEPPIFVMLSFLGVRGFTIRTDFAYDTQLIERDNLILPELLLEDFSVAPETLLRPAFDIVWQSCGYPASANYDDNDQRVR